MAGGAAVLWVSYRRYEEGAVWDIIVHCIGMVCTWEGWWVQYLAWIGSHTRSRARTVTGEGSGDGVVWWYVGMGTMREGVFGNAMLYCSTLNF